MARITALLKGNRSHLCFCALAALTLLACVLRTLALFLGFDADIGYFRTDSALAICAGVCTLLCIALCVTVSFLINKGAVPDECAPLSAPRFICAAACTVLLCPAILLLIFCTEDARAPALLALITAFCLLGTAAYLLSRLLAAKSRTSAALGFFMILAAATLLATTYFDRYTQMNAPHKISLHLCMLSVMFAALYELRALLARSLPRACVLTAALTASLCTVYALSNTIAFLGGVYDDVTYFLFDLATLGFAAYFTAKTTGIAFSSAVGSALTADTAKETEVEQ